MKSFNRYFVLSGMVAAAVLGGFVGGTAISAVATPPAAETSSPALSTVGGNAPEAAVEYPVNRNGQSYGADENARGPADAPDLIAAWATNGKYGYVLKTDVYPSDTPSSPEEALANQKASANQARSFPVYEADGETVIGEFTTSVPIDLGPIPVEAESPKLMEPSN
jgi:hypothetical protein